MHLSAHMSLVFLCPAQQVQYGEKVGREAQQIRATCKSSSASRGVGVLAKIGSVCHSVDDVVPRASLYKMGDENVQHYMIILNNGQHFDQILSNQLWSDTASQNVCKIFYLLRCL